MQQRNLFAAGPRRRYAVWAAALVVLVLAAGCGRQPSTQLMHLDPKAPAAAGLLAAPGPDQPSPMQVRPPFGQYAHYPADDTLKALSTGTLSPDGQFRFAMTAQGLWITRSDAAWLWEVGLPPIPATPVDPKAAADAKAATTPADPTKPAQAAQPPKPRTLAGVPQWTDRGLLLLYDATNTWFEANPVTGVVRTLPAAFTGAKELTPSPDGTQVFYYLDGKTGRQLWTAKADGTGAKLVGENLIAHWDAAKGTLQTQAVAPATPANKKTLQVSPNLDTPSQ